MNSERLQRIKNKEPFKWNGEQVLAITIMPEVPGYNNVLIVTKYGKGYDTYKTDMDGLSEGGRFDGEGSFFIFECTPSKTEALKNISKDTTDKKNIKLLLT